MYQYQNIDDATVLEIFARINTYSVALNAQELRNGKYFGEFKKAVYALALRHLEFWRDTRVFTDAAIARMHEAQLVSELLVMQMDGLQDKKSSIEDFALTTRWGLFVRFTECCDPGGDWFSRRRIPQHVRERLLASSRVVGRVEHAVAQVVVEERQRDLFQRLRGCRDLGEDVDAVGVGLDHAL